MDELDARMADILWELEHLAMVEDLVAARRGLWRSLRGLARAGNG